jgi:hypothetical protein
MKRVIAVLLLLSAGGVLAQQRRGVVMIPYSKESASRLTQEERRELEIIFATTVEKALDHEWAVPGQYVNLDDPNIRFVREYNLWLEKRRTLMQSFGVDVFQKTIDVQEMARFARAEKSWEAYCKSVDDNYKQFKRAKQRFKTLRRTIDRERDGVYR